MPIHLTRSKAAAKQITDMLIAPRDYIKLAVDIDQGILAGGGALNADCEAVLLENGSRQESISGADWVPSSRKVYFEALINLRPRQQNLSMTNKDPTIRRQVALHLAEESAFFIEWAAPDAAPEVQCELLVLQRLLVSWIRAWEGLWNDPPRRKSMRESAGQWAQRLLQIAGLVP